MNRIERNVGVKKISAKSNLKPAEIEKKVSRLKKFAAVAQWQSEGLKNLASAVRFCPAAQ